MAAFLENGRGHRLLSLAPHGSLTASLFSPQAWAGQNTMRKTVPPQWELPVVAVWSGRKHCTHVRLHPFTSKSATSLKCFFICNMGTTFADWGSCKDYKRSGMSEPPLTVRRIMMINKAGPTLHLHLPSLCFNPPQSLYSASSSHVASLLNLFYTPSSPQPRWLFTLHCLSLECFAPDLPMAHSSHVSSLSPRQNFPDDTIQNSNPYPRPPPSTARHSVTSPYLIFFIAPPAILNITTYLFIHIFIYLFIHSFIFSVSI